MNSPTDQSRPCPAARVLRPLLRARWLFLTSLLCPALLGQTSASAPNVVLILCDDLGYGDLAHQGHDVIETPNIDALARDGLRLTAMYAAAPMCSPSRAGLLTGRSPQRSGIYDWIPHDGTSNVHLRREEFTLAAGLQSAGYQTSLFGKWHLNGAFNSRSQPQPNDHGFDHWFATQFNPPHTDPLGFVENGRALPQLRGDACQIVVDRAVEWLETMRDPERPFFQFISFHEPHHPIVPPAQLVDHYRERARNEAEATYFASVHNLDLATGRYLATLENLGLARNTIVLFTSDHGPQSRGGGVFKNCYGRSAPFRGSMRTLLEGGLRVPTIVRWPGRTPRGTSADQPVGFVDLLPTLAQTCGFSVPNINVDGEDVGGLLFGDAEERRKFRRTKALHWHFYAPLHGPQSALRDGRWKLTARWDVDAASFEGGTRRILAHEAAIRGAELGDFELFDLLADPEERQDVSGQHPETARRLAADLIRVHREVRDEAPLWAREAPLQDVPNILFIVSEDNGPELGCYGDPFVRTPVLDELAAGGVRFDRAFVPYSVCSPSRACFLTGLWPQQNGQLGLATHRFSLYEPTASLPSWLKVRGYRTGIIGKLHVNPEGNFPWDYRAIRSANFGKRDMREYAAKASEFLAASGDGPWFLQVNFPDAHFPLHAQQFGLPSRPLTGAEVEPLPFIGADSPRLREFTANYYNCMSRLDSGVGMLLDALDATGARDNTLIVYIGDHGAQFSRGKCSVYEAGLRIPMIVQWPGHTTPGAVRQELVSTLDLVPTLLAAADVSEQRELPGRSLTPLLGSPIDEPVPWRTYIQGITTGSAPGIDFLQFSIRDDRFKLIWSPLAGDDNPFATAYRDHRNAHFLGGTTSEEVHAAPEHVQRAYDTFHRPPPFELYDLHTDPHEFQNLAEVEEHRATRERLFGALEAWQDRIRDPLSDATLRATFVEEQVRRRDGSHRRRGFVWPYLERFRRWRAERDR